jgi:hypothetical protein
VKQKEVVAHNTGFLDFSCAIYAEEDEAKERLVQFFEYAEIVELMVLLDTPA